MKEINFLDKNLGLILEKVRSGERLSLEDGMTMFHSEDLLGIGAMAHEVKKDRSGDAVYYVLNQKIEPTNVCVLSCKFCDFATQKGKSDAYEMTINEILDKLRPEIVEVHITGALHPDWEWNYYLEMVRQIKQNFPAIDVKAFTAVEIDFFHKKFKMSVEKILTELKSAGLRSLPGGGAEVFSERIRRLLFNQKIGAKRWLEIHKIAHHLGLRSNATLLYGHIETFEERVQHLLRLRDAQDQTGGFLSFIPLPFHPGKTGIKSSQRFTSAVDDLKTISVSRLMLDNIPHIKAYWVMLTEEVASVALNFGADDIDGTVGGEKIAHNAGAITPMKLAEDQIVKIILDAKKIPVKRDIYYNPISVSARRVIGKIPYLNSVPFYHNLKQGQFKLLPVVPRRMGMLLEKNMVDAGLFSLVDFLRHREVLERLNYGIATRDQVRSVMLFSKYGWADLEGRTVGITDETATSVLLLRVLLETKYSVKSKFKRMGSGSEGEGQFDAVLLIGDSALKCVKSGLGDYDLVYDLATEWYQWQKLPFVFAVWAVRKDIPIETRTELEQAIGNALESNSGDYTECAAQHSRQIGWTTFEAIQYLEGFNYHLGEQELRAIEIFEQLGKEIEVQLV